jgi:hypothetical protein
MVTERPQRDVTLGVGDAEGFVGFAHYRPLAELAFRSVRVRRASVVKKGAAAEAAASIFTGPRGC